MGKKQRTSLDDRLFGGVKTASNNNAPLNSAIQEDVLSKLAALKSDITTKTAAQPTGEGEVTEQSETVATTSPAVDAATSAVENQQTEMIGPGSTAARAKGMVPTKVTGPTPVITTGENETTTARDSSNDPEAVAEATKKTAMEMTPAEFGKEAAIAFNANLEQINEAKEASECFDFLKAAGVLANYEKGDELEKVASLSEMEETSLAIEKIAKLEPITNREIILVSNYYEPALEKEAEAEKAGQEKIAAEDERLANELLQKHANDPKVLESITYLQSKGLMASN